MTLIKLDISDKIEGVYDNSDEFFSRIRIEFTNGYQLSVIRGEYSYGGKEGLYEIAIFNSNGNYDHSIEEIGYDFHNDDVIGYLTEDDVKKIAMFVGGLK